MDFTLFWRQTVPGFDKHQPFLMDEKIAAEKCELWNVAYNQTCQKHMVNQKYQGCFCNHHVCPQGYTWNIDSCVSHSSTPKPKPYPKISWEVIIGVFCIVFFILLFLFKSTNQMHHSQ